MRQQIYPLLVSFFLAMSAGFVIGNQGDGAVLAFSAAMLSSLFWWREQR